MLDNCSFISRTNLKLYLNLREISHTKCYIYLQWKLLAMKQTNNSLLNVEERPGVLQRNTVSAISDSEGIGSLGKHHLSSF